jgi:hypothetical protein
MIHATLNENMLATHKEIISHTSNSTKSINICLKKNKNSGISIPEQQYPRFPQLVGISLQTGLS